MKYSIIIPCYNEGENIYELAAALEKAVSKRNIEFILVENGSKDNTRQALEAVCIGKNNFKIVYVDNNQGYGFGLIQGMKAASGDYIGWLHADLQVGPSDMMKFIDYVENRGKEKRLFLKGIRGGRSFTEHLFTGGMTIYVMLILKCHLYDIGAIPVLFHKSLLKILRDKTPYDFSIETYVYYKAKKAGFSIRRFKISMKKRQKGQSSWDKGISSKLRQSKVIAKDILKIKKGEAVKSDYGQSG